jgi:hypothetical protein
MSRRLGFYPRVVVTIAFAIVSMASMSHAQSITGIISDRTTSTPVAGVLVTLRDSTLRIRVRTLSDSAGRFLMLTAAGRVTVNLEHIAYAPHERTIDVTAGDHRLNVALSPQAVQLKSIVAESRSRCGSTRDAAPAKLWYFARTALASSTTTAKNLDVRMYSVELDKTARALTEPRNELISAVSYQPFKSINIDSLFKGGFVQRRPEGLYFYGPDADVLLSDQFVDNHCFAVVRDKKKKGLIGLSFRPGFRSKFEHDIRGAMWIDENTGELKLVDYYYTGFRDVPERLSTGRVEFERLKDGSWIIPLWYIRMPRTVPNNEIRPGAIRVLGATESGGEVITINGRAHQRR